MAATLVVSIAVGLVVLQPAAAAHEAGDYECPAGAVCLWQHSHYGGLKYQYFGTNDDLRKWNIDDNDSAWRNNGTSGLRARIWEHIYHDGVLNLCLAMGTRYAHDPGSYYDSGNPVNDEASSNDWRSTC